MSTFGKLNVTPALAYVTRCEVCGKTPYGTGRLCIGCRRRSVLKTAAVVFIVAEGIFVASLMYRPQAAATVDVDRAVGLSALPTATTRSSNWKIFDAPDASGMVHHRTLASAAPREDGKDPSLLGVTQGTLDLSRGQAGKSVTITFAKVKENCTAGQCSVRASFDETQPQPYAYSEVADAQNTVLKLTDYDSFVQRLSVSHDLTVVASLGNATPSVMRFTVAGYDSAAVTQHLVITLAALPLPAGRPYPG